MHKKINKYLRIRVLPFFQKWKKKEKVWGELLVLKI